MALVATFGADFDKFESSLKSATFNLQVFDRATKTAMQGLKRETESLSGSKLAVEAARMAEAVKRLGGEGGVAAGLLKLTDQELKKLTVTMDAVAVKAGKLGEKLPQSLQDVRTHLAGMTTASETASNGIGSLVTGFKAFLALGVTAKIAGIAASVANAVDQFDALAGRISDTTDNVQRLQAISQSYDVTLDALVNGVQELQKRLGDPSDEFVAALGRLNLRVADLKQLAPTDAIVELLGALGRIPDASDRAAAANATLGRSQKELAAAMKDGVEQTDAWVKMAPSTIDFVDSVKTGAERLGSAMLALTAETAANASGWNAWQAAVEFGRQTLNALFMDAQNFKRFMDTQKGAIPAAPGTPASILPKSTLGPAIDPKDAKAMAAIEQSLTTSAERAIDLNKELADAAKEAERLRENSTITGDGFAEAARWMETLAEASQHLELNNVKKISDVFEFASDPWMDEFQTALDLRAEALRRFHEDHSKDITKVFDFGPDPGIGAFERSLEQAAKTIKGTFIAAFKDLPQLILRALEGGGDLFKSIGALFGSKLFGEGSELVKSISGGLSKALGKSIGGALGLMLPGLGTLLGSGLGSLADKLLGKLFGGEGKKVNDLRDQFTAAAGGIDKLAEHAAKAGKTLKAFYAADTVKEYEAAIRDLEDAFGDLARNTETAGGIFDDIMAVADEGIPDFLQGPINQLIELGLLTDEQAAKLRDLADKGATNWDKVREAADRYGVRVESLGQPFQAQRIAADAAGIINAFTTITNAGGDVGGVLFDMQDEIQALVDEALKFNIPIPANLKPLIDELSRAGLLTGDLDKVQFGDEIETEAEKSRKAFEGITEAIRELIRTINRIPAFGGLPGGGVPSTSPETPGPSEGTTAAILAGGGVFRTTFTVPIEIDGRQVADVVIDQMGNRLAVRGAR